MNERSDDSRDENGDLYKRLIHYPVEFIEYVILHEFAHFVHPNHSRAFYALIEKYMPDYKERIAMSQRN